MKTKPIFDLGDALASEFFVETPPPNDGFEYVDVTAYGDERTHWLRVNGDPSSIGTDSAASDDWDIGSITSPL